MTGPDLKSLHSWSPIYEVPANGRVQQQGARNGRVFLTARGLYFRFQFVPETLVGLLIVIRLRQRLA